MTEENWFETLSGQIGREAGLSDWIVVDQKMIDSFADTTRDHQYIHVDPLRAAQTPFGATIAHGFLTLSLLSILQEMAMPVLANQKMGINYGFDRVRFVAPVRSGARIRGRFTLADATLRKPGLVMLTHDVIVEIEGEAKPALTASWLNLFEF